MPPAPQRWVTDQVGFLSPSTRRQLDERLEAYQGRTGHHVLVWIGDTIGNDSLERWAADTFKAWGVGRKGQEDGVVLFILAKDRRMRLEVGYGLEGQLPDITAARILREELAPRLQRGDRDGAVLAAVNRLLRTLGGEAPGAARAAEPQDRQEPQPLGKYQLAGLALLGLLVFVFLARNPRLAGALLYTIAASGRGGGYSGGGFSGGGGYSGGGGRSGGGGASGSW